METSSAHHDSLDPANLANFKNKLNVPSRDGLLGLLDASAGPVELAARRERVEVAPGTQPRSGEKPLQMGGMSQARRPVRHRAPSDRGDPSICQTLSKRCGGFRLCGWRRLG